MSRMWSSDAELFDLIEGKLYTPVVGDILDSLGYLHQFLPQPIQPMTPEMKLAGRAFPVLGMDVYGRQDEPFGKLTSALDDLAEGEVYIAVGGAYRCANWGELMTAAAKMRGARGAVVDGFHRDTPQVLEQRFPVFSRGRYAQDSAPRYKVADFRLPIEIGGVGIRPGDIVFADCDGVLIVPREAEEDVFARALEKAATEKTMRKAIEEGSTVTAAFEKYGVL